MDSTELDDLLEGSSDDPDLVRKLRQALKDQGKGLKAAAKEAEEARAALKVRERDELFETAGIPKDGPGALLRKVLAGEEDLTAEKIREEAIASGVIEPPAPVAGVGEQEAHQAFSEASSASSASAPSIEDRIRQAKSKEEVLAIAAEAGVSEVTY
jgi:hypothetical protein